MIAFKRSLQCCLEGFISIFGFPRSTLHFENVTLSILIDGIPVTKMTVKCFRNLDMLLIERLSLSYPKFSKDLWNKLWRFSTVHPTRAVLWWPCHLKLPLHSRLYKVMPHSSADERCLLWGVIEIDKHFLSSYPVKRPIWDTLAHHFLEPSMSSYE